MVRWSVSKLRSLKQFRRSPPFPLFSATYIGLTTLSTTRSTYKNDRIQRWRWPQCSIHQMAMATVLDSSDGDGCASGSPVSTDHSSVSHVCISPGVANAPIRKNIIGQVLENGNTHRHRLLTKAQTSLEADTRAKDSVTTESVDDDNDFGIVNLHHVGILCENLEQSLDFYQNLLACN